MRIFKIQVNYLNKIQGLKIANLYAYRLLILDFFLNKKNHSNTTHPIQNVVCTKKDVPIICIADNDAIRDALMDHLISFIDHERYKKCTH